MADAATEVVDEAAGSYAWESELQRTWDAVEETADGELRSAAPGTWHARVARDRSAVHVGVKRGVMRAVFLIIDCSRHAADHDAEMKPTRRARPPALPRVAPPRPHAARTPAPPRPQTRRHV